MIWNTSLGAFEAYVTANYGDYDIAATEQGTASAYYTGTFPSTIVAGVYSITAHAQVGGSPAETDPVVAAGDYQWNGSSTAPLSDTATSGQVGQLAPIKLARGVMVVDFPIYMKSAADHITPFTSGVISGQIARGSGAFGALQSGVFFEKGLGFYTTTLTSGDLAADSVRLLFTATGISGGVSDPLPMSLILQKVSGF